MGYVKIVVEPPGPRAREAVEKTHKLLSPSISRYYPLVVGSADGCLVRDIDGNQYIDLNSGIAVLNVGSSHPRVVEAIEQQVRKFAHYSYTDFYYENINTLAERLTQITPGEGKKRVFYGNSGAEAIEAAMKLSRYHTRRPIFLAFTGAFHGRTFGALSLTASKPIQTRGFSPLLSRVVHLPYPYCYRCPLGKDPESCDTYCANFIREEVLDKYVPGEDVAALFFEPIQGEGGYVVPPGGFFKKLEAILKPHGILMVDDEIQAGMGRTGRWWAIEHYGITPDIICIAKAIGGGLPLGVTIARDELMTWEPGSHASTFGGNPVAAAAALATIDVIEKEKLLDAAAKKGDHVMKRLKEMKHEIIGEVRGKGLMIGVELIKGGGGKEYGSSEAREVVNRAWKRGVLLITSGRSTLRIVPPLTIQYDMLDEALDILDRSIGEVSRGA